jgi:HAD superfamily hydrolase (TIGR01509 family)
MLRYVYLCNVAFWLFAMSALHALIFDVDGTLAETERDGHRVAFNQTFQAAGLDWYWSVNTYGDLLQIAGGKERIQFFIEKYRPPVPPIANWSAFIADLHHEKTRRYTNLLKTGTLALRPGVKRLIQAAQDERIRLAIATTSRLENALALLQTAFGPTAPEWFDVIAAGDIVPHKKPASDIYRYVLDKMALPAENCVAIEDTEHGLTAAAGAGLSTVIAVNDYSQKQDFSQASLVLTHLGDPQHPCQVLNGPPLEVPYFTLAMATRLLPYSTPIAA